jgi:hypothetical protein
MSSPFSFPDWMPWWMQLVLLLGGILVFLALLLMPFSVFGLKGRLDTIEVRLDEIQGEIRTLALRLPEPGRRGYYEEEALRAPPPAAERVAPERGPERVPERVQERVPERAPDRGTSAARPPIPPAGWSPDDAPRRPIGAGVQPPARQEPSLSRGRAEPRIDRFR